MPLFTVHMTIIADEVVNIEDIKMRLADLSAENDFNMDGIIIEMQGKKEVNAEYFIVE